jgi:hypothetical protein
MIKKVGLICLIILLSISAYTQIQIGLKGGYTFLSCSDWNDYGTDKYTTPRPSYLFSVFARQRKHKIFNLGMEFEYSHNFLHVNSKWGYNRSYTILIFPPILLRLSFSHNSLLEPVLNFLSVRVYFSDSILIQKFMGT